MADWRHSPELAYGANLAKQLGTEQFNLGRETTAQGVGQLGPVSDYFKRLLGGDTQALMGAIGPEADAIGAQFAQIRRMISTQPRGGGRTAELAQLPVTEAGQIQNLLAQARRQAPQGLEQIAQLLTQLGVAETGQGAQLNQLLADIALQGRAQDLSTSWKAAFQRMLAGAAGGLAAGVGQGLGRMISPQGPSGGGSGGGAGQTATLLAMLA